MPTPEPVKRRPNEAKVNKELFVQMTAVMGKFAEKLTQIKRSRAQPLFVATTSYRVMSLHQKYDKTYIRILCCFSGGVDM